MKDILQQALEEQNYLMHHGILGQKWGIRRYQNPDGSLTDEGRKRYGKPLSEKIKKAEKAGKFSKVNKLAKDRNLMKAYDSDRERKHLRINLGVTSSVLDHEIDRINQAAWKKAGEEVSSQDIKDPSMAHYARLVLGQKFANDMFNNDVDYNKARDRYEKYATEYERESKKFVEGFLGDYGNQKSPNPLSIKYNTKNGVVEPQTLSDRLAFEMYRNAGGKIR